ncbi:MAG: phosphoenolpyruvate carboxykinase domain-containing protein, partial [Dehalococcoidia bacterium]
KREDPNGIEISGIIYGGRDSDTSVPVQEAFNWAEGIITKGAGLESETTAATLGKQGVRVYNPMSNLDFLSIPIGRYIQDNLDFGARVEKPPRIFAVNYFLRNVNDQFLNHKNDKKVWLQWMELRVNNEANAIKTPIGYIPEYTDLKRLFKDTFGKEYSEEDYNEQFTIRIPEYLAKVERLVEIYKTRVSDTPAIVFDTFNELKTRLEEAKEKYGEYILPEKFL